MAVPRNRSSNAAKNSRRAHHAKNPKVLGTCSNCGSVHAPHAMCTKCGFYNGREVIPAAAAE